MAQSPGPKPRQAGRGVPLALRIREFRPLDACSTGKLKYRCQQRLQSLGSLHKHSRAPLRDRSGVKSALFVLSSRMPRPHVTATCVGRRKRRTKASPGVTTEVDRATITTDLIRNGFRYPRRPYVLLMSSDSSLYKTKIREGVLGLTTGSTKDLTGSYY